MPELFQVQAVRALHIACFLADQGEAWKPTAEIAEALGEGLDATRPILRSLKRAGLLLSRAGLKGGYKLGRPAAQITIADVARAAQGDSATRIEAAVTEADGAHPQLAACIRRLCGTMTQQVEGLLDQTSVREVLEQMGGTYQGRRRRRGGEGDGH